jgi:hypothetical protein
LYLNGSFLVNLLNHLYIAAPSARIHQPKSLFSFWSPQSESN